MVRRLALLFVTFAGAVIAAAPNVLPFGIEPTAVRATPTLSGAQPLNVTNGDFSGSGLGTVGTPPTNSDFETAGSTTGTPPTNNDFETGNFTGWTLTGSPTVQSGGPTGYYAELTSGQKVKCRPSP